MRAAVRVVTALIEREGTVLITQRRPEAVFPLLWELPGGRVRRGESDESALARAVYERIGVTISVKEELAALVYEYEDYQLTMVILKASLAEPEPRPTNVNAVRWVAREEIDELTFPPADQATMAALFGDD